MADIERKYVKFSSIKCTGDPAGPGGFEGHTSIAGNLDDGGDIILDGAFKDVIAGFLKSGFTAHSHDWNIKDGVIGYPMEAREDKDGLFVSVKFHSTDDAQNVRTKMRERIADGKDVGLSIGYRPQAPTYIYPKDYDKELPKYLSPKFLDDGMQKAKQFKFVRVLTKMGELKETSVVTSPMNTASQVDMVKDSDGTVKAGARNSASDARKIQAIHDMATELHPEVCSGYQAGGKAAEPVLVKEVKDIFDDSLAEVAEISPWGVWDAFSKTLGKIKLIKRAAGDMNVDTTGMLETALAGLVTALRSAAQNELDDADTEILPYAMYGRSEAPERKKVGRLKSFGRSGRGPRPSGFGPRCEPHSS
jgi:HK97 family phage prohead protease